MLVGAGGRTEHEHLTGRHYARRLPNLLREVGVTDSHLAREETAALRNELAQDTRGRWRAKPGF